MKKLFVSIVGTHDWQCRHMSFKNVFDFQDFCLTLAPEKEKMINDFIDAKHLCEIMSDSIITYRCSWE